MIIKKIIQKVLLGIVTTQFRERATKGASNEHNDHSDQGSDQRSEQRAQRPKERAQRSQRLQRPRERPKERAQRATDREIELEIIIDVLLIMSYLSKCGYVLKKASLDEETLVQLKSELRGRPLQDTKYTTFIQRDTTFPLYIETKNKIYIPKMYGIKKFGKTKELANYIGEPMGEPKNKSEQMGEPKNKSEPMGEPKNKSEPMGEPTEPMGEAKVQFNGTLFDYQQEPCDTLYKELVDGSGGGILSLGTGYGKTFCTLYVLSKLRYKTIVIVNKISLLKQWETEIKTYLPGVSIGYLQGQKNVDIVGKDIVLAMLQSLSRIDYPEELFSSFGVTVVDECHNISSPVFSRVLTKICSRYTIGLSATPTRSDGCEYIFEWFLGDVIYRTKSERRGLYPVVHAIKLTSDGGDYREITSENKITGQKQIMYTSMLGELVTMEKRNGIIVDYISKLVAEGRKILVLSDRREHVKLLYKMLRDSEVSFTYGLFVGQMKVEALEQSKRCQVILATYQAFGEGVSEKSLDTLLLVTPKKFIGHLKNKTKNESGKLEQIVGRIFRKEHTKVHPLIVDFQDDFSVYKSQSAQRLAFYKEHFKTLSIEHYSIDLKGDLSLQKKRTFKQGDIHEQAEPNADADILKQLNYCFIE